jgi:predicted DNA-binding transcriptional regulator AlpA
MSEAVIASLSSMDGKTTDNPSVCTNAVTDGLVNIGRTESVTSSTTKIRGVNEPVMGLQELAAFFGGLSKRTVWKYILRDDFPEPYARLSTGKVWLTADVERWQRKHEAPFQGGRKAKKR